MTNTAERRHFLVAKLPQVVVIREFDPVVHPLGAQNSKTREQAWSLAERWARPAKAALLASDRSARRIDFVSIDGEISVAKEAAATSQELGKETKAKNAKAAASLPWEV